MEGRAHQAGDMASAESLPVAVDGSMTAILLSVRY